LVVSWAKKKRRKKCALDWWRADRGDFNEKNSWKGQ